MYPCPDPRRCTGATNHREPSACLVQNETQAGGGSTITSVPQPHSASAGNPATLSDGAKLHDGGPLWTADYNPTVTPGYTRSISAYDENIATSQSEVFVSREPYEDGLHLIQTISWDDEDHEGSEIDFANEPEFLQDSVLSQQRQADDFAYDGPAYLVSSKDAAVVADRVAFAASQWNRRKSLGLDRAPLGGQDWVNEEPGVMHSKVDDRDRLIVQTGDDGLSRISIASMSGRTPRQEVDDVPKDEVAHTVTQLIEMQRGLHDDEARIQETKARALDEF